MYRTFESHTTASSSDTQGLSFQESMAAVGFAVDSIIADGEIHRFQSEGDRRENSWYVCSGDHGAFGNWRTGEKHTWQGGNPTKADVAERRLVAEQKRKRTEAHIRAAINAQAVWEGGLPADPEYPYLKKKRVLPHGIRQHDGLLVIPLMDIRGSIFSIQFIDKPKVSSSSLPAGG